MDRIQKKCFLFSAAAHGLLLLCLLVGAAFSWSSKETPETTTSTTMLNPADIESVLKSGSSPSPGPAPVPVPAPRPTPVATPPAPTPTPPTPRPPTPAPVVRTPTPPQPEPPRPTARVREPATVVPVRPDGILKPNNRTNIADSGHKTPKVNTTMITRPPKPGPPTTTRTQVADAGHTRDDRKDAFNRVLGDLKNNIGGLRSSEPFTFDSGSGIGGNYLQVVLGIYDEAWNPPSEIDDDNLIATVRVKVARSGRVISASITKRSGNTLMDRSVQQAIEAVQEIKPFPSNSKDIEKNFKIDFNLKAKRASA